MNVDGPSRVDHWGCSGIGAALAEELSRRGARVATTAQRKQKLAEVAARTRGDVVAFPGDVRDRDGLVRITEGVAAQLGPIHPAVLNAGAWEKMDISRWDSKPIREQFDTNLLGMLNSLDAVRPDMIAGQEGTIVGVASVAGYRGYTQAEARTARRRLLQSTCSSRCASTLMPRAWTCRFKSRIRFGPS
jgi:NADP-dependent 3-hydroxy acid dehydrogenase YdfG